MEKNLNKVNAEKQQIPLLTGRKMLHPSTHKFTKRTFMLE